MSTPLTTGRGPGPETPALEPGDRLTRDEFERRYDAMPDLKRAELIEGVVYMPSPVRVNRHASPHADFITWLGHYRAFTPGVRVAANASIRLDLENEPQPDGALIVEPAHGGSARISADDYIVGGPELVAEIASSTVSIDLTTKFRVYRRSQVQEYVVWRVREQAIDWFKLHQGDYARLTPSSTGIYESEVFPGLSLDAAAMIRGDLAHVLHVLDEGLRSPGHAGFVRRLEPAARRTTS